jgi:protein TonB
MRIAPKPPMSAMSTRLRRSGLIALGVLGLHAGLIWALQKSLAVPMPEILVPVSLLAQAPDAPAQTASGRTPQPSKTATSASARPNTSSKPLAMPSPVEKPSLQASPIDQTEPTDQAPVMPAAEASKSSGEGPVRASDASTSAPNSALAAPSSDRMGMGAHAASALGPAAPAAIHTLQPPSTDAAYLRNPKPLYPLLSQRLKEQGTVVHNVLIAADGRPVSARLIQSSGFERLDKAAYDAVMRWRYVPGRRQGAPEVMSLNVPVIWVLE